MKYSPLISDLIDSLRHLPGVGAKSAQRMAFHLLERNREGALSLSEALAAAMANVKHCNECRTFTESERCHICANDARQTNGVLCIVESPQDILAIEQTTQFHGTYFVLMGHLSPIVCKTEVMKSKRWPLSLRNSIAMMRMPNVADPMDRVAVL